MAARFAELFSKKQLQKHKKATKYGVKILNGKLEKMKKYFK